MKPLTSLADFHFRVKSDSRYRLLAIEAYQTSSYCNKYEYKGDYETAINWIEEWTKGRISRMNLSYEFTSCQDMIDYLNRKMEKMSIFKDSLISPLNINTFTQTEEKEADGY